MHRFQVSKEIAHPLGRVWPLLDNFSNTYVFHPIVERSEAVGPATRGAGARRKCTLYDGGQVQEQITKYEPLEHRYKVEVVDHGPFPLRYMEVWIEAVAEGNNTRVTYRGGFVPKFGPLGWVMGKLVMKGQFEKMMGSLIDGLNTHLSTGRMIEKNGSLGAALQPAHG